MNELIASKLDTINRLCQQYHVEKLEVFGSVTHESFDPENSDLDFLVEFNVTGLTHYADNYFGLLSALESLFDRSVDLVVGSSIKNPYFLESIATDREYLYAA